MSKLVLVSFSLAGLLQAGAGCIISADDDDDVTDRGDGNTDDSGDTQGILYQPTWTCPPDADTITFTATPAGSSTSLLPDTFRCAEATGDILYAEGDYDIDIQPDNEAGEAFLNQTDSVTGVDRDLVRATYIFPDSGGFFGLTWTIDGAEPTASCTELGADRLAVDATLVDTSELFTDEFPCEDGQGITDVEPAGWPIGEYVLDVSLVDATGTAISDASPISGVSIDFGDHLSSIGTVDFVTTP